MSPGALPPTAEAKETAGCHVGSGEDVELVREGGSENSVNQGTGGGENKRKNREG